MNSKKYTERGQVLVLIALAAIGLVGIVGLAIDGSAKFSDQRHAQNAADTAAIAGSLAQVNGDNTWKLTALDRANSNGYDNNLVSNTVTVYACDEIGSDCGPYAGDSKYVRVVINSYVNTTFARIIGMNQLHNKVDAVAKSQISYTGALYGGASIIGLAPDQCKTIWFSGNATTNVTGGGVFSNSNEDCGVTIAGSTALNLDGSVDMVANAYTKNGNPPLNVAGGFHSGADQYDYPPPPEMLPNPTCSGNAVVTGSSMSPGNYSGTFPPGSVTSLDPGTYCVTGNFRLNNANLSGTGVTIFMKTGGITWNGGSQINLAAPTSGDLAGMLIYAPPSNTSAMSFNGNASSTLTGTLFMPSAPITYNGTGDLNPSHAQIIGYTIKIDGSNNTNVVYTDGENWDATSPAQVGLMK